MNTIDSDVFIIRQLEDLNQTQTYYQKHLKFSLKSKFYLGLPIGSDDNIIEEFNDLFQESSVNGTIIKSIFYLIRIYFMDPTKRNFGTSIYKSIPFIFMKSMRLRNLQKT